MTAAERVFSGSLASARLLGSMSGITVEALSKVGVLLANPGPAWSNGGVSRFVDSACAGIVSNNPPIPGRQCFSSLSRAPRHAIPDVSPQTCGDLLSPRVTALPDDPRSSLCPHAAPIGEAGVDVSGIRRRPHAPGARGALDARG